MAFVRFTYAGSLLLTALPWVAAKTTKPFYYYPKPVHLQKSLVPLLVKLMRKLCCSVVSLTVNTDYLIVGFVVACCLIGSSVLWWSAHLLAKQL